MDETTGRTHFGTHPVHRYEHRQSPYGDLDRTAPLHNNTPRTKAGSDTGARPPTSRERTPAGSYHSVVREQRPVPDPTGSTAFSYSRAEAQCGQYPEHHNVHYPPPQLSTLDSPPPSSPISIKLSASTSVSVDNRSRSRKKTRQPHRQGEDVKCRPTPITGTMSSRPVHDQWRARAPSSHAGASRVNSDPPEEVTEDVPHAKRFKAKLERFREMFKKDPINENNYVHYEDKKEVLYD